MALIPTMISEAVGEKTLIKGKLGPAPNKPDDVKKIQALLKKVLGPSAPVFKDGVCDDAMKSAIAEFQGAYGLKPDKTVDKAGHTLKHLDRLANPWVLKPIAMCKITQGGYVIIGCATWVGGPRSPLPLGEASSCLAASHRSK